tara:strand:+ start:915 stop:1058 length:144 start_codon:yes stop_codon:yes gene_type:complete
MNKPEIIIAALILSVAVIIAAMIHGSLIDFDVIIKGQTTEGVILENN